MTTIPISRNPPMKKIFSLAALLSVLTLGACNKEYLNPSTASQQQVDTSPDALIPLANGLQSRFTTGGGGNANLERVLNAATMLERV